MSYSESDPDLQLHQAISTAITISIALFTSLTVLSFPRLLNPKIALVLVLSTICLSWHFSDGFPDVFAQEQWLRALVMFGAHLSHILVIRPPPSNGRENQDQTIGSAFYCGYKLLFNCRGIGTDWELPHLHRTTDVQPEKHDDPITGPQDGNQMSGAQITSRWPAVRRRIFYLLVNYLVLCLYYELLHPALYLLPKSSDFTPTKENFVRRIPVTLFDPSSRTAITSREIWIRCCMVVELVIPEYFWLSSYHDISAIIFIGVGLDRDDEWPPIMGPVYAATTLRGFWGRFWHRILYRSFSEHASVLARWLGFRKGTRSGRLVSNFLVFVFSAVMHAAVGARIGNKCAWGRNMWFWLLQPVGFIIEAIIQANRQKVQLVLSTVGLNLRTRGLLEHGIGYLWVSAWFFWVEPKRIFPLVYCGKD